MKKLLQILLLFTFISSIGFAFEITAENNGTKDSATIKKHTYNILDFNKEEDENSLKNNETYQITVPTVKEFEEEQALDFMTQQTRTTVPLL